MTKEDLAKIREHIEIHSRKESHAIKITQIMKKALAELERIEELEKENAELNIKNKNAESKINKLEEDNYNLNCNLKAITDKLTKAKEVIRQIVIVSNLKTGKEEMLPTELFFRTENFLTEG